MLGTSTVTTFVESASGVSDGIMFGILAYVICKLFSRKFKDLKLPILIVALLFILKIVIQVIA